MDATSEIDFDDEEIASMAVAGLTAATSQALASGHPVVLLRNEKLVRISPEGEVFLKELPPKVRVRDRKAQIKS